MVVADAAGAVAILDAILAATKAPTAAFLKSNEAFLGAPTRINRQQERHQ
jgi:hypothetical protein